MRVHLPRSLIGSPRVGEGGKGAGGKERGKRREGREEGVFRDGRRKGAKGELFTTKRRGG